MGLFSASQLDKINAIAAKSNEALKPSNAVVTKSINDDLIAISQKVQDYFKDSKAIRIRTKQELHDYVSKCIEVGYAGIDTETTGLDRIHDTIVGFSLYTPGLDECYIPCKHLVPIFDTPCKDQLTYQECGEEIQRLVDAKVKLILANADFDIAMIYKDFKVDIVPAVYYDVILAWRCIQENEKDNTLKGLYAKYPKGGKVDPQKFSDFFPVKLFPYCKPEIAALYAANDARITYELFLWQLPFVTKTSDKCKELHLEKIADLVWNVEFPMISVCAHLHRVGMYLDQSIAPALHNRYYQYQLEDEAELHRLVQELIDTKDTANNRKRPFRTGADFNPNSNIHVKYLINDLMGIEAKSTGKDVLKEINKPVTQKVLDVRGDIKLLGTYVDKMPKIVASDNRVHGTFKSIGADCITGDSILITDKGYRTIKDICECNGVKEGHLTSISGLTIVNKDQQLELASGVIKYSDVDTIKITTECGFTIEGTPNHPIMVSKYTSEDDTRSMQYNDKLQLLFWKDRYFKKLEDISIGDYVELPCDYAANTKRPLVKTGFSLSEIRHKTKNTVIATIPEYYTKEFAELLGMYHADGSAASHEGTYTIGFSNCNQDVIDRIDELSLLLFNVPTSHYTKQAAIKEVETYINCKQIEEIDSILAHGKQNKKIPDAIWLSPTEVINAYIKGMTLDSSVYRDESGRAALELSIINEEDARFVQYHLASQGILCYWSHNENKDGWKTPRLAFNADNYIIFRDVIGFVEKRKYLDTQPCAKGKYSRRRVNNSFRVKVKKIEHCVNTVYDLHVPGTHSFISNGMISHNTGRMASSDPNMQNIPSKATDIRHLFRARPGYVLMSSDYSQQEPRLTAFVSSDKTLISAFQNGRDVYATLSSISFKRPYEDCLEFHPETHEYQPEGKKLRGMGKVLNLGITYGMSVPSIAESLFATDTTMTEEEKLRRAQEIYDAMMNGFPGIRDAILRAQQQASTLGYTETILGRRRHHPDMMLPRFEFKPMPGYVNPDVDPLDPKTLENKDAIPQRVINKLTKEFNNLKYYGQIVKRTKQLAEEKIAVINNTRKIDEASRMVFNAIIQGSAADMTKMAMLKLENDPEWKDIDGSMVCCIHDELLCEVPIENREEGAEILARDMVSAGDFLPFKLSCDVETTFRWYGLAVDDILSYDKPTSLDYNNLTESNICWLQCMILENEYLLPVYKEADGSKPIGIKSHGVNGIVSEELKNCIQDYKNRYNVHSDSMFLDHIEKKVIEGVY